MKYYIRTTGERELDSSFSQINYELLLDEKHEFHKIFADQLLQIADDDVVLLEDDIVLCRDFESRITQAISERPCDIINFFSYPGEYIQSGYSNNFWYNQCTYYPKEKLKLIGNYLKDNYIRLCTKPLKFWHQCVTVGHLRACALTELNQSIYIYRPCLVQHLDINSLIWSTEIPKLRRSPYFIDYLDDLNLTYEDCALKENQLKLHQYMKSQFDEIDKYYRIFDYKSDKPEILIVGYGVVGHNLHKELEHLAPDIYDKFKPEHNTKKHIKYDFCFICVDTPYTSKIPCDISQVEAALEENDAKYYVIKSTVLPGTIDKLLAKYHKHIIFSPEYYGGTQHCNNYDFNFTILGGDKKDCIQVQQLLQKVYDARHTFHITDAKTAELSKYMENAYLGMKVSFCNQFFDIAESCGVDYEELRELFILDPRVEPSHTFVYRDEPYWDSHCLNKDIAAIAQVTTAPLIKNIIDFNTRRKAKHDRINKQKGI